MGDDGLEAAARLWARAEATAWSAWPDWASTTDAQRWQELGGHAVDHLTVSVAWLGRCKFD